MLRKPIVVWTLWALLTAVFVGAVNWNNHLGVSGFLTKEWDWTALYLTALGLLLRRYVLRREWEFWSTTLWSFFFTLLAAKILQPEIPTPNMASKVMWGWAGMAICWGLFVFFSDVMHSAISRLLSRLPSTLTWGSFVVSNAAATVLVFTFWAHTGKKLSLDTLVLSPDFMLMGWCVTTLARRYVLKRTPEFARTLFLFLVSAICYMVHPDFLVFYTHPDVHLAPVAHHWTWMLILGHTLLTGLVAAGWEEAKEGVTRWRSGFLCLAFVGWGISAYFNGIHNTWFLQSLALAFFWFWEPHLRKHPSWVVQGLLSVVLLKVAETARPGHFPELFGALAGVTFLRLQFMGRGAEILRTFLILSGMLLLLPSPNSFSGMLSGHSDWMWIFYLLIGSSLCLAWEKLSEEKSFHGFVWGSFFALGLVGLLGIGLRGFIPGLLMGAVWCLCVPMGRYLENRFCNKSKTPTVNLLPKTPGEITKHIPNRWGFLVEGRRPLYVAGSLVLLVVATLGVGWMYHHSVATVVSFTPSGEVTSRNVRLSVKFTDPVRVSGDLNTSFQIQPPLPGMARLEDERTLVFEPSAPLKPATKYSAEFSSRALRCATKWVIQTSSSTKFQTQPFEVKDCRLYFVQDPIFGREKELVAELAFNYPVDPAILQSKLTLSRGNENIPFRLEGGSLPTRFYVRSGAPERGEVEQKLTLSLSPDLVCAEGGEPLGKKYENALMLPAKPEFKVESVHLHHRPGSSMLAVLFSLPINGDQLKSVLSIDPPLPLKIETEYRYAVLSAPFKPNVNYTVMIGQAMRAQSGETLKNVYKTTVTLQDAPPYVRFADVGRLVPLKGPGTVAVQTMNLDSYRVNVSKVFKNNLVPFLRARYTSYRNFGGRDDEEEGDGDRYGYEVEYGMPYGLGSEVWSGMATVTGGQINEPVESALTFRKWQQAPWKGLFVTDVRGQEGGGFDSRWFLATDLGLMAKRANDDLWVQVLSLSDVRPSAGVTLKLVSENNQVIQSTVTDLHGRAWFKGWRANPYKFEPFLIMAEKGDDWSFLRLDRSALDASRFDVGGVPAQGKGWDAFLTTDRGLYRPGDHLHVTGVVRHADLKNAFGLPVRLKVFDVSGTEISRRASTLDSEGVAVFDMLLPEDASTGAYAANLELDNGDFLSHATFKVEEFIPHKIKVAVEGKPSAKPSEVAFHIQVNHLFGPPAAKLKVRSTVRLVAQDFTPKGWDGWRFIDDTRKFPGESLQPTDATTDEKGRVEVTLPVPDSVKPSSMLKAVVYAECFDTGGRPVAANASIDVHRYGVYLGLKGPKSSTVDPSRPVTLGIAAVSYDGKVTKAASQNLLVKRRVWYSIFHHYGWSDRGYESSYYDELVEGKTLDVNGKGVYVFTPKKPGQYTVFLGTEDGARTSLTLTAEGIGAEPGAAPMSPVGLDQPEILTLTPDRKKYRAGEIPKVTVRAPFEGRLVLTVEREKVFWTNTIRVHAGLNVAALPPVGKDWSPNVYVAGLLVRPPHESERNLPRMSFGVAALQMDLGTRRIETKFHMPKEVESRQGIPVTLDTGVPGARVVLSAVDEGVLRIIGFATPDPFGFFYRKRSLTTSTWSLFTDVLPELSRRLAVGGDADEAMLSGAASKASRHLNPVSAKRVVTYAQFKGDLKADARGRVRFLFPAKGFHGQVRVMALAVKGEKFGSGSFDVEVADPVVLEPSFPRFLAPNDSFDLPLMLSNQTPVSMSLSVSWSAKGPVKGEGETSQSVVLPPKGQDQILFHGKALPEAGKAVLSVVAKDAKGRRWDETTELSVRPPNPLTTLVDYGEIKPGQSVTLSVPGGFIAQGQKVRLSASSSPLLPFLGSLDSLIGYPYGCAEQIVSKSFPLLYLKDLGLCTGRFENRARAVEFYVQEAVDKIEALGRENGTFAYWPHETSGDGDDDSSNDYLANYCSHFLLEAKRLGYDVKDQALDRVKKRIGAIQVQGNNSKHRLDRREENVEINGSTYVLYLRALAGVPDLESMKALRDQKRKDALLSLAFTAVEDLSSGKAVLPERKLPTAIERRLSGDWFSSTKYDAEYLLALAACDPHSADIPILIKEFGKHIRKDGSLGSTQDNAWGLMALAKAVSGRGKLDPLSAEWSLIGGVPKPLTGETAVVSKRDLSGHKVVVHNKGEKPMYFHLMAEGTRLEVKTESEANGITVSREYRDEDGKEINLGAVTQGQIVVVTLKLRAAKALDNVVIVDLLPAGFEVDNPRLSSRGSFGFEPACSLDPAYRDFRDDRVLLFTHAFTGEQTFSYSVRAVTPGRYVVPSLLAEAMYDPDVYGRSGGGETLVVAPLKY